MGWLAFKPSLPWQPTQPRSLYKTAPLSAVPEELELELEFELELVELELEDELEEELEDELVIGGVVPPSPLLPQPVNRPAKARKKTDLNTNANRQLNWLGEFLVCIAGDAHCLTAIA